MKKIIISIILFSIASLTFGQNFTLSELIKINNYKLDDFDTYVTQKGYKFDKSENIDFYENTSYAFYTKGVKDCFITKFYYKTSNVEMVSFQTKNTTTYLKIKSDLKILGFKIISTESIDGDTLMFIYEKGKIEVSLIPGIATNSYGFKYTYYEISVKRLLD